MNKDDYNFKLWCIVFIYYLFLFIYWSNPGNRSNKIVALFFFLRFRCLQMDILPYQSYISVVEPRAKTGFSCVFFVGGGGGGGGED